MRVVGLAERIPGEVRLDDAAAVQELDETGLAHDAQGDDSAGDGDLGAFLDPLRQERRAVVRNMGLRPLGAEGVFPGGPELGEFLLSDRVEVMGDGVEVGLFAHVGSLEGCLRGGGEARAKGSAGGMVSVLRRGLSGE